MKIEFQQGAESGRLFESKRPMIQTRTRVLNENAPNPYSSKDVELSTRMAGRGVSGESTN